MFSWEMKDLQEWNSKIEPLAKKEGLDFFEQEFEICDSTDMLAYMVYSGMPSHYPHWSYGKSFEKLKTLYDYGMSGLPYEMVINSDPCLAYLMRENSLALQALTMCHVYGHNDFFKNNRTFSHSQPQRTIERFNSHANRVRGYIADSSVGTEKVEALFDAAHALSLQCRRNLSIRKLTRKEQEEAALERALPRQDDFKNIHKREEYRPPDLTRVPLESDPEEDILLFIRDYNPRLSDWERDCLTIVHEQSQYFIPQIETKIMNEGWASFWHKRLMEMLDLPQEIHLEFLVRHSQVLCPTPGGLNPYYLGLCIWNDLVHRYDEAYANKICDEHQQMYDTYGGAGDLGKVTGLDKIFRVREADRDVSFIRNYLAENLIREMNLFEYQTRGEDKVISNVADDTGWRQIKETLMVNVGSGTIPVIKVVDSNYNNHAGHLLLRHEHDGSRDLQLEYAEKTLGYVRHLWNGSVCMETVIDQRKTLLVLDDKTEKLEVKPIY